MSVGIFKWPTEKPHWGLFTPRKEVIHPQLRLGIPCYNLALIADLTLALGNPEFQVLPTLLA